MEIEYNDFKKIEMKVGTIRQAERMQKTEKLYKIKVDMGDRQIQIISSLAPYYTKEELIGKKIVVLTNLKPAKFAGEFSEGMLLCAETDDGKECVLLTVDKDIKEGTQIT